VAGGATAAFANTAATSLTPVTANDKPSCLGTHDDIWPLYTDGRPTGIDPGVSVWHDFSGWHVRVTHATLKDRTFSGAIHTGGQLLDVKAIRLEANDSVKVSADKKTVLFRFNNYGGVDGFDFRTHCAPRLEMGFLSDGVLVPANRIAIGHFSKHPANDP